MYEPQLIPVFTPGPPSATPGNCFFCHAPAGERGAVSTGSFIEAEMGTIEECDRCIIQATHLVGGLGPDAADELRAEVAHLRTVNRSLGVQSANKDRLLEILSSDNEVLKDEVASLRGKKARR